LVSGSTVLSGQTLRAAPFTSMCLPDSLSLRRAAHTGLEGCLRAQLSQEKLLMLGMSLPGSAFAPHPTRIGHPSASARPRSRIRGTAAGGDLVVCQITRATVRSTEARSASPHASCRHWLNVNVMSARHPRFSNFSLCPKFCAHFQRWVREMAGAQTRPSHTCSETPVRSIIQEFRCRHLLPPKCALVALGLRSPSSLLIRARNCRAPSRVQLSGVIGAGRLDRLVKSHQNFGVLCPVIPLHSVLHAHGGAASIY